ncbi:MAG: flagellar export chaperone FliS [Syntrophomonas sp.]|nr:flagellar export chaperone FliS [Syntrophomonas sp.]
MSVNALAYSQYQKTSIVTGAPEKMLLMLYDGAIKNIIIAKKAIKDKDINLAHEKIIKTEDILAELMSTLNMDYEVSLGLFALYEYLIYQLVEANYKKDIDLLAEVEGFLSELRKTWAEAIQIIKTAPVSESSSPGQLPSKTINVKG